MQRTLHGIVTAAIALAFVSVSSGASACPLPGSYVVTMTGELATGIHFARLAMYAFDGTCAGSTGSGTIVARFWQWQGDGAGKSAGRIYGNTSLRIGAPLVPDAAPAGDAKKRVRGLRDFNGGKRHLTTLDGTWSLAANALAITWANGDSESWAVTWADDPAAPRLYKLELTGASFVSGPTYLATAGARDASAANAGWAFGGPGPDFTYAKETEEIVRSYYQGLIRRSNAWCGAPASDDVVYDTGLSLSVFTPTTKGALRYAYPDANLWVYVYFGRPKRNRDLLARRVMIQTGHDWDGDGTIADDAGHTYAGLEVVDASGAVRGFVFADSSLAAGDGCGEDHTISAIYYLDAYDCDALYGVDPAIGGECP